MKSVENSATSKQALGILPDFVVLLADHGNDNLSTSRMSKFCELRRN